MRTIWRVTETGLVPTDEEAWEALRAHKIGSEVLCEPKGARNPKQLRLWWSLCTLIAENDPHYEFTGKDGVSDDIKIGVGIVKRRIDRSGQEHIDPGSIAPEKMDQGEFNSVFTRAINLVCDWTGNKPKEIQDEVFRRVADKRYEGYRR